MQRIEEKGEKTVSGKIPQNEKSRPPRDNAFRTLPEAADGSNLNW